MPETNVFMPQPQLHILAEDAVTELSEEGLSVGKHNQAGDEIGQPVSISVPSPSTNFGIAQSQAVAGSLLRSRLRDGTDLDYLRPDRPFEDSVWERSDLGPNAPPAEASDAYAKSKIIERRLLKMSKAAGRYQAHDFSDVVAREFAPYFGPIRKGTVRPKLAKHRFFDPIDPVVIFKRAVPLVHGVLLQDPHGNDGLDLDGMAYIIERLAAAKQLQGPEKDIRFAVLEALSFFVSTVLAKASPGEFA